MQQVKGKYVFLKVLPDLLLLLVSYFIIILVAYSDLKFRLI